jgi:hypothetical protein
MKHHICTINLRVYFKTFILILFKNSVLAAEIIYRRKYYRMIINGLSEMQFVLYYALG